MQPLEHLHAAGGVAHDGALGDLEPQQRRGHAVLGEQPLHQVGQGGVEQAAGREVDRDRHRVAGVQPGPLLGEGHARARARSAAG